MDGPSQEPGLAFFPAVTAGWSRAGTMLPHVEKPGIGPRTWEKPVRVRGGPERPTKDGEAAPGEARSPPEVLCITDSLDGVTPPKVGDRPREFPSRGCCGPVFYGMTITGIQWLLLGRWIMALLLLTTPARAQEAATGSPAEVPAGPVADGPGDHPAVEPGQEAGPVVKLRGVVAFVSRERDYFHVIVGSRTEGFRVALPVAVPEFGQQVEVDYRESSARSGGWDALAIEVLGQGQFPEPTVCTPDDIQAGRYNRQWVEVEGVVLQVKYATGFLWIQMVGKGGWGMANVYHWPEGPLGDTWWGAKVRIRGLNIGKGQNAFRVHGPELVTVLSPGLRWPFDLPETPMAGIAALTEPRPDRVKIRATILGVQGNIVFLRSGGIALQADLMYPFDAGQEPSGRFLEAPKIPWLDRGDEMDVVGSPLQVQPFVRLQLAQFKVVQRLAGVTPREVSVEEAASGRAGNDLVTLRGRLRSRHETGAGPLRRETLELMDGNQAMPVILDTRTGGFLQNLAPEDLVEATGIVEPAPGTPPWVVRLAEAKDVKSLGLAPEVASARRWKRLGWLSSGLILVGGTMIFTRRRQLRQRERVRAIRDQNAALEKRVVERTAELEVARDELKRSLEQERELGELKSRFVSTVSHEFRTPLGIIMSAVELLQNYADRLPAEQQAELMDDVRNSTLRMSSMMEQVLVLGRAEAGKLDFRVAPLEVEALICRMVEETLRATHQACPIIWEPEDDLAGAEGDEALLRHIVTNLLSNAVKYSVPGTPVLLGACRQGRELVLTVKDAGIGIPEADQVGIFEAFHRGSNVGERPGTGLGLVIVQRCVELHGGSLALESAERKGSTFSVRLPVYSSS